MKFNLFFIVTCLLIVNFANAEEAKPKRDWNEVMDKISFGFLNIQMDKLGQANKDITCFFDLEVANNESTAPIEFFTNSKDLIIHREGNITRLYSEDGMVEINGLNCKTVDKNKKIDSGILEILQNIVANSKLQAEKDSVKSTERKLNVIAALRSCKKVSEKLAVYSEKTLKEKFNMLPNNDVKSQIGYPPAGNPAGSNK